MSRVSSLLAAAAAAMVLASGIALAQQAAPNATRGSGVPSAAPGKGPIRPKPAPDRAASRQRKFDCLQQARARRLHFGRRRAFMRACLAGGR